MELGVPWGPYFLGVGYPWFGVRKLTHVASSRGSQYDISVLHMCLHAIAHQPILFDKGPYQSNFPTQSCFARES